MSLFDRLQLLIRSNLTDLTSSNSTAESREGVLQEAKSALGSAMDDEARLELELDALRRAEASWEERAVAALEKGDEAGARKALADRNRAARQTEHLMQRLQQHRSQIADLLSGVDALEAQIEAQRLRGIQPTMTPSTTTPNRHYRTHESENEYISGAPNGLIASSMDAMDELNDRFAETSARLEAEVELDEIQRNLDQKNPFSNHNLDEDDPLFDPERAELERRFRDLEKKFS